MTDARAAEAERSDRAHGRTTLVAVCGATFMLLVDVTIVQVALPQIQRRLGASFSDQEWVISGYSLTLAALLLTMGSLADRFGRKRIFVFGVAEFTLSSLACGLAPNALGLIVARGAQGIGGGAMFATALALIGQEFRGEALGRALAAWGATVGGAVAVGPLLGGLLTNWFGWRSIFFVNVPIGALLVLAAGTRLRNVRDPDAHRLDLPGVLLFSSMLFFLVYALVRAKDDGFASTPILTFLAISGGLLLLFAAAERRSARPMLDLSLFRNRSFVGISLATFAISSGAFGVFPYITFYLQDFLGYSPLAGGVRLLPSTVLTFAIPIWTRKLSDRLPPGPVLALGLLICAGGLALCGDRTVDNAWTGLLLGFIVLGLGIGIANPALARIALGVVPRERAGMASGIANTFRIGGLAIGVATLGAIFGDGIAHHLPARLSAAATPIAAAGPSAYVARRPAGAALSSTLRHAYLAGYNDVIAVGVGVLVLGALAALAVRGRDLHTAGPRAGTAPDVTGSTAVAVEAAAISGM